MKLTELLEGEPLPQWMEENRCQHCRGTGMEHPDCPVCSGDGEIFTERCGQPLIRECPKCEGEACHACDGIDES